MRNWFAVLRRRLFQDSGGQRQLWRMWQRMWPEQDLQTRDVRRRQGYDLPSVSFIRSTLLRAPHLLSWLYSHSRFRVPSRCTGTELCCGTKCVDPTSSNSHCGGCGVKCDSTKLCCGGVCKLKSAFKTDPSSCGSCTTRCGLNEECCGGACKTNNDYKTDSNNCECGLMLVLSSASFGFAED